MKRAVLITLATGCLSVPEGPAPMCDTSADCDTANGEVCDEGICWGNPPPGPFSAVVSPPSERSADLVSEEIAKLELDADGWVSHGLQLSSPLVFAGRLSCGLPIVCGAAELTATITITRPSSFPGGPAFSKLVTVDSGNFQIALPPTGGRFDILVMPDGRNAPGTIETPAQLVPPLFARLEIGDNLPGQVIGLGGDGPTLSGSLKNEVGQAPQGQYRVVALGRWDPLAAPQEVSTVDFTGSSGIFSIELSGGLVGNVEIVAKPIGLGAPLRPTLHLAAVRATDPASDLVLAYPQGVGNQLTLTIPVEGVGGNGEIESVRGARVVATATVVSMSMASMGIASTTILAEGMTNDFGVAEISVLDGPAFMDAGYRLSIVPPANATMGVLYDVELLQPIPAMRLPTRVALRGKVLDVNGDGVKDMSVTARPSLKFVWSLDATPQAFLTGIPPATATTPANGEFVLWVDHILADTWGHYDFVLEPTSASARVPSFVLGGFELPRQASMTNIQIPTIQLPDAAFVRGMVYDDIGEPLEGAELKVYAAEDQALCQVVKNPPSSCSIPARLVGRGAADNDGIARLTLPRPIVP